MLLGNWALNSFPEGSFWKRGLKGSAMIFPVRCLSLESCRTSMEGRWRLMNLLAERTICCSLPLERAYSFPNEEVRMDLMMFV